FQCNQPPSIFAHSLLSEWAERESLKRGRWLPLTE
ncbi:MAG: hypothetical protein ACI9OJ_000404, partial [Myxococcota bacterium]